MGRRGLGPRSRLLRLEVPFRVFATRSFRGPGHVRDDYNLNRPWAMYMAALVVWCYGFPVVGPTLLPPALATAAEQRRDMLEFLKRVGGVRSPHDLQGNGRNRCLGLLMILRDGFVKTRWEMLTEAASLLGNCIANLRG